MSHSYSAVKCYVCGKRAIGLEGGVCRLSDFALLLQVPWPSLTPNNNRISLSRGTPADGGTKNTQLGIVGYMHPCMLRPSELTDILGCGRSQPHFTDEETTAHRS